MDESVEGLIMKEDWNDGLYLHGESCMLDIVFQPRKNIVIQPKKLGVKKVYTGFHHNTEVQENLKIHEYKGLVDTDPSADNCNKKVNLKIKYLFNNGFFFNEEDGALKHVEARKNIDKEMRRKFMTSKCKFKFCQKKFWKHITESEGTLLLNEESTPFSV
jgi:hypothetical protein